MMKKLSFELKVFITLIVLCIAGIVFSTIAIDKQIDNYIEELKTEIKIVNNGNDEINIDHENNKIVITVNPIEEEESEEVTEIRGMVISNDGLNIRQNPSVESERIGVLEYGSEVIILEDCGDWYRIDNGYIFKDYVIRI
jgi:uncharacterized protein YgiM (DUF1202 family)